MKLKLVFYKHHLLCELHLLLGGFTAPIAHHIPQFDSAISSFAILASVYQTDKKTSENSDLKALIDEIDFVITLFDDPEIDDLVKDVAIRHLHVLKALLNNVDAFGIDAAMAAYAELVVRLRREDQSSKSTSQKKISGIWSSINKFIERLTSIDKAVNTGENLLTHGHQAAQHVLGFLSSGV